MDPAQVSYRGQSGTWQLLLWHIQSNAFELELLQHSQRTFGRIWSTRLSRHHAVEAIKLSHRVDPGQCWCCVFHPNALGLDGARWSYLRVCFFLYPLQWDNPFLEKIYWLPQEISFSPGEIVVICFQQIKARQWTHTYLLHIHICLLSDVSLTHGLNASVTDLFSHSSLCWIVYVTLSLLLDLLLMSLQRSCCCLLYVDQLGLLGLLKEDVLQSQHYPSAAG